jgi:hypothetical protein
MTSLDIFTVLREVLIATASLQFDIIAIIGDGAQCNRQYQKKYFTDGTKDDIHMKHPITRQPIYYISDPSHMIKKIVSSLSSRNRNIFKVVDNKDRRVSLTVMFELWMSFNDNLGLNRFKSFKTIDFIKNSFQAMRVGPCIKVLGPRMVEMIDLALLYKEEYLIFNDNKENENKLNPYEFYKNAEIYLGWREASQYFSKLFNILNSTDNRLNTTNYSENYQFLIEFQKWFLNWKAECIDRKKTELPAIHTAYEGMTGFFTAEASEDCLSMIESLIAITNHYCNLNNNTGEYFFFLPRCISQDLVENAFSRIRVAIGHGRLDHITTFNACTEVNMIKEVKISERSLKRRNAAGAQIEILNSNKDCLSYDDSIEYASNCRKNSFKNRIQMYGNSKKLIWKVVNGVKMIENTMSKLEL